MKSQTVRLVGLAVAVLAMQFVAISAVVQAEETGMVGLTDSSFAVNAIVSVDKESRLLVLKRDEGGGKWAFIAGPEVQNFDHSNVAIW